MPTQADWQTVLLLEVGAGLDAPSRPELDRLTPNINLFWNLYADKASIFPRLQYLYTKRHLIMVLEGTLRNKVSGTMGENFRVDQSDSVKNLQVMYKQTQDEIRVVEKWSRSVRPGVVQRSTTRYPYSPAVSNPVLAPLTVKQPALPNLAVPDGQGDPNSPAYRGDPLVDPNGTFAPRNNTGGN